MPQPQPQSQISSGHYLPTTLQHPTPLPLSTIVVRLSHGARVILRRVSVLRPKIECRSRNLKWEQYSTVTYKIKDRNRTGMQNTCSLKHGETPIRLSTYHVCGDHVLRGIDLRMWSVFQ